MIGIASASRPPGRTNEYRVIERNEPFPEAPWRSDQPKPSDPITIEEAVSSWVREITAARQNRRRKLGRAGAIVAIGTLAATIGVSLAGFALFFAPPETNPIDTRSGCPEVAARSNSPCVAAKSDRDLMPAAPPEQSAPPAPKPARARPTADGRAAQVSPARRQAPSQQKAPAPNSKTASVQTANRSMPVPETKPGTVEGWTVREVAGGTAILDGPRGAWRVKRGDTVPGLGKVDSIVHWGSRWIVATSTGLISTP